MTPSDNVDSRVALKLTSLLGDVVHLLTWIIL